MRHPIPEPADPVAAFNARWKRLSPYERKQLDRLHLEIHGFPLYAASFTVPDRARDAIQAYNRYVTSW